MVLSSSLSLLSGTYYVAQVDLGHVVILQPQSLSVSLLA